MQKLGVVPKLRLGVNVIVPGEFDKKGNPKKVIRATGSHAVKFLEEPTLIMGKNFEGEPRKEFRFIVEENGKKLRWHVPILNKEGQPNYLLERLEEIKPGDVRILEMMSRGAAKYIDIRKEGEDAQEPDDDEIDEEKELAKALALEAEQKH